MKTQINNFYQYNNKLAAGGQPNEAQLAELKQEGCEVVFNISPVSARNALQTEAAVVEQLGMIYVHFPVDCSNLQTHHFETFRAIVKSFETKQTFIHCGGNIKTSNLLHLYNVLENKKDEQSSLKELRNIQNPESKWFVYFKQFGLMAE